jgi:hypothetical protein
VAAALVRLYQRRHAMAGLRRTYAAPLLSHFTAQFEPVDPPSPPAGDAAPDAAPTAAAALADGKGEAVCGAAAK